jgi:hypothetical protein
MDGIRPRVLGDEGTVGDPPTAGLAIRSGEGQGTGTDRQGGAWLQRLFRGHE